MRSFLHRGPVRTTGAAPAGRRLSGAPVALPGSPPSRRRDQLRPCDGQPHAWKTRTWDSGVSGIVVHVPEMMPLNATSVECLLSDILGVGEWKRVQGPD